MSRANAAPSSAERARVRTIVRRLARAYGPGHAARPVPETRPPLDELILTVLSQNTSDLNRDRAWTALRARFPSWEDVARARTDALERTLRPGGLAAQKAPRIKTILREIRAREGALSLEGLRALADDEVIAYLTSLPGVGIKTAACVLAFSLGRSVLPVDTHVARIAARLALVSEREDVSRAHAALAAIVPARGRVETHLNLIAHGRSVCTAARPRCDICPIADLCPSAGNAAGLGDV